eukprot:scaffold1394_cov109-Isochrysis_galbana.AAC.2
MNTLSWTRYSKPLMSGSAGWDALASTITKAPPIHSAQPTRSRSRKPSRSTSAAMKAFDKTDTAPSGAMSDAGAKP